MQVEIDGNATKFSVVTEVVEILFYVNFFVFYFCKNFGFKLLFKFYCLHFVEAIYLQCYLFYFIALFCDFYLHILRCVLCRIYCFFFFPQKSPNLFTAALSKKFIHHQSERCFFASICC